MPPAGVCVEEAQEPNRCRTSPSPGGEGERAVRVEASRLAEQLVDVIPVHEVFQERLEIVRAAVAVVDVVGVLPDVAAENRRGAMHQRILTVRRLGDFELAALDLQPAPAGAELA